MTRGSAINESLIYVSYHNIDIGYAFQLSTLLIRYYRRIWLDRYEIAPGDDWQAGIRAAREGATGVIAVVSDEYLDSAYCRAEYTYFQSRGIAVTAVIPRDFSTEMIADFNFSDWVDFRRWFDDPNDLSIENLLSQIPESESVPQTGERLDYLRSFIEATELALAKMPTSWLSLRPGNSADGGVFRPRLAQLGLISDWAFTSRKAGKELPLEDLLQWAADEPHFVLSGERGSGKSSFARLLTLAQAHDAMGNAEAALPIWLDLAEWDERYPSVEAFIEAQWSLVSFWQHWLAQHQALIILDNWDVLRATQPAFASALSNWLDGNPNQRFVVVSSPGASAELKLPIVQINGLDSALAQRYAGTYLTLDQQNSFRQLLRQKEALIEANALDYLSMGLELLSVDRALAFNQWQTDPMPALITNRLQQNPNAARGLRPMSLLSALRGLAWSMMQQDNHRYIDRSDVNRQVTNAQVIDCALDIGILLVVGERLSFENDAMQRYLSLESLKQDGLVKYLTRPEFSAGQGRAARKWDALALTLVDSLAEDRRARLVEQIADIDPFLALESAQRHPALFDELQESLINKLLRLCAQNPAAQSAFRSAVAELPEPETTAELLVGQVSQLNNASQSWLWQEVRALPLAIPLPFIQTVAGTDRESPAPVAEQLSMYPLSLAVAWLVKLSGHQDEALRRNAIWMLGELKYLPTAILLLDYLEAEECDDRDAVLLALMQFAYSEILVRVLRWSQEHPEHRPAVIAALAERKRLVTSHILALADANRLTLNPEFYETAVENDEADIAIGMAQIAANYVDLPEPVAAAIASRANADELQRRLTAAIKYLPSRQEFADLVEKIERVLADPPESTVIAGSKIGTLLYGQPLFDDFSAQAESKATSRLPADLRGQLQSEDWQQRHRGLNRLMDYPAAAALPILLDATEDDEKKIRLAAYEMLARFEGEVAAEKALIAALSDPDSEILRAVTDLLKSMRLGDADDLVELLDSANPDLVGATIAILGSAGHIGAAGELRRLLSDGRMPRSGSASIGQLARTALAAIEAAESGGEPALESPKPAETDLRDSAGSGYSDEEKITRTLAVLRDDDWGRTQKAAKFLRRFAKHLRGRDNPQVTRVLLSALRDDNWSVRWAAAEALAVMGNRAAIPHLSERLADPSWIVQVSVVRGLVELGAATVIGRMLPLLGSPVKAVREAVAEACGELKASQAIARLGETLKNDADDFVRFAALRSIQQIDRAAARPWLELALSDGYLHLRLFAMEHLAPMMDESHLPLLKQLLQDDETPSWESESMRDLSIMTLKRIDSDKSRALLASQSVGMKRAGA